jgi:hypothetical protein
LWRRPEARHSKTSVDTTAEATVDQQSAKKTNRRNPRSTCNESSADAAAADEAAIDQPSAKGTKKKKSQKGSENTLKNEEGSGEIFVVAGLVQEEVVTIWDI